MSLPLNLIGVMFCILLPHSIAASPLTPAENLHKHPTWLALGHYQKDWLGGGYTSQADDDGFFLSPEGRVSPKKELAATISALQHPRTEEAPLACRFPARYIWLKKQLRWSAPAPDCPAYQDWLRKLDTRSVTLVFAASYLNSPSSMFGHTFLRLDPARNAEGGEVMLSKTISYAAEPPADDNELAFAIKGLFGGYPGGTTVQPYYEKIRLYSALEHRDLWEYRLNLTEGEIRMMLAHAWELKDTNFDYYFLDENCAYRLLALIDVAREDSDLLSNVTTHAIPTDTVRWVMRAGLVDNVTWRASQFSKAKHLIARLPEDLRNLSLDIAGNRVDPADSPAYQSLSIDNQALLLDATYEYIRYQSEAGGIPRQISAPLSHRLLSARSRLDNATPTLNPPAPEFRDDQGHATLRAGIAVGSIGGREFTELSLQPAYHALIDPPGGYRPGAALEFLSTRARRYDNGEWQLEALTLLGLRSITPRTDFFSPLSWQIGFGGRRTDTGTRRVLTPYVEGGAGGSWRVAPGTQAFALATGDLEVDDDLSRGYDMAPGADLGVLYQGNRVSLLAGTKTKAWIISDQHRQDQLYGNAAIHFGRSFSLFAQGTREHHFDRYQTTWQMGLHAYF
ncbi:MAG: DUF4105 domain-containing protein [Marinobacter sp.]|nr:DUF4105 domain-containing protein [Marinobacter sp.]